MPVQVRSLAKTGSMVTTLAMLLLCCRNFILQRVEKARVIMSDYQVMPDLTVEEYAELKADIERRGVMVPVEFDELGNVLDGHHRLRICKELGIKDYPKVIRVGMTESEKLIHARKLNIARRHLKQKELEEKNNALEDLGSKKYLHKLISVFNPTKREIKALSNPEVIKRMCEDGVTPLVAEQKILKEAKATRKAYKLLPEMPDGMLRLFVGDIQSGLCEIENASVDFIITDPPYSKKYLPLYSDLSRLASRVLKQGGSLIVMTGDSYLPDVMTRLSENMNYYWTLPYLTPGGGSPLLYQKRVNTFWKPVLWYVKGEYKGDYVGDILKSPESDKRFHEWGQSLGGMIDIIERFSNPNDVILDPFLGGGTTGVSAVIRGRKFIGVDIKQENIDISRKRILNEYASAVS